jgi:hypothetical protein
MVNSADLVIGHDTRLTSPTQGVERTAIITLVRRMWGLSPKMKYTVSGVGVKAQATGFSDCCD